MENQPYYSISVPVMCLGLARHFEAGYDAQTAAANRIIHIFQLDADTTVTLLSGVLLTKKSVQQLFDMANR